MATINGVTIPTNIASRGAYRYRKPETIHLNGNGVPVVGLYYTIEWTFSTLESADFQWWYTTLLSGAAGATFTSGNSLPDQFGVNQTFSEVRVYRPEYSKLLGGIFYDVVVRMEMLG